VYNQTDIILVVLDNSTTAMTGQQPHPGTGVTMMGEVGRKVSIEKILEAVGARSVRTVDPLHLKEAINAVKEAAEETGVRAIVFRSPCIAVTKPSAPFVVTDRCVKCKKCINDLGCPAIVFDHDQIKIEKSLCFGCALCAEVCPTDAISPAERKLAE
jgi:indolepyruvate ferredoxin oxidoreductase alpha subunit